MPFYDLSVPRVGRFPIFVLLAMASLPTSGCGSAGSGSTPTGGSTAADTGTTDGDATAADTTLGSSDTATAEQDTSAKADSAASNEVDAGTTGLQTDTNTPAQDTGENTVGDNFGWGPEKCANSGPKLGFGIGDRLGHIAVQDCDTGATRTLDEVCGADATWLFVAHSHCPTCNATAKYTADLAQQYAGKNVAVVHVVYIDDGQSCPSWREKHGLAGIPNLKVYLDKTGASWSKIKTKPYTAPHAIMTKDRVITYKAHGLSGAGVKAQLDKALKK